MSGGNWADWVGFPWFPVIDIVVIVSCQIFNLERAYRINRNKKWVMVLILPPMLVCSPPLYTDMCKPMLY